MFAILRTKMLESFILYPFFFFKEYACLVFALSPKYNHVNQIRNHSNSITLTTLYGLLQERCPVALKAKETLQEALHLRLSLVRFCPPFMGSFKVRR